MSDAGEQAVATARAFIEAFNAQDHPALAETLNYPHIRLANGTFQTIPSLEAFVEGSRRGRAQLEAQGWDHTVMASVEVVHEGPDKVHLAITNDRYRADGSVYNRFETLWIVTLLDGHWGVQFRSSYLRSGPSPESGGSVNGS